MTTKRLHINLILLVFGVFSLQSLGLDALSSSKLFLETEIEEAYSDVVEADSKDELFDSGSGGGEKPIISTQSSFTLPVFFEKSDLSFPASKGLSKKAHLFILYCCLKLDC